MFCPCDLLADFQPPDICEGRSKRCLTTAATFPISVFEMHISTCTSKQGATRWLFGSRRSACKATRTANAVLPLLPLQASDIQGCWFISVSAPELCRRCTTCITCKTHSVCEGGDVHAPNARIHGTNGDTKVRQEQRILAHSRVARYFMFLSYENTFSYFAAVGRGRWPGGGKEGAPCLLWCSGHWHCANAGWCDQQQEEKQIRLKVGIFVALWAA